jgi:hypothetical protein
MKTEIFGGMGLRIYGQILIHARGLMINIIGFDIKKWIEGLF